MYDYFKDSSEPEFLEQERWFNEATEPDEATRIQHDTMLDEAISAIHSCQSPIESCMLKAMLAGWWYFPEVRVRLADWPPDPKLPIYFNPYGPWDIRIVTQQQKFGSYRADFAVWRLYARQFDHTELMRWSGPVVVECDGHDYHERSKAQAAHDKRRDRWFALNGMTVLRFTGSEIHANPSDCVRQINRHFEAEAKRNG
jgi:hypothetical protein